MAWSLVETLGAVAPRRAFYPPLACIPPGETAVRAVNPAVFTPSETTVGVDDKVLTIRITPPFAAEGALPDPAYRLHAMAPGTVRFEPRNATFEDRLILEMPMFLAPINAPWWQRWIEARCLPYQIIYENVDRADLEARLRAIALGSSSFGLDFPPEIMLETQRSAFVTDFMTGAAGHIMSAEAGAYIGTAATDPAGGADRVLMLHARYNGHTDANPRFMNPREFLNLLFSNDSAESISHPLMLRFDAVGLAQAGLESRTMRLRPPLRTFGRLEWEANLEINSHQANWAPTGMLGAARFYNTHARDGRTFNTGGYTGSNKCNLFTSDIALRSGFRAAIHDVSTTAWHYVDANSHANLVHSAAGATDRVGVMGRVEDAATTWAWKFENWIRAQTPADLQTSLNDLITSEGRCLVLAGARGRRFINQNCGGSNGICDCTTALRLNGIGHIVLVREVLSQPTLAATVGEGLQSIRVRTLEASGGGAESRTATFQTGGAAAAAAGLTGFIRLHLFELHPGGDPDTVAGLRNLNTRSENRNLLRTANEAAANQPLNLNPNGTPRTDHRCCHDQWPATNGASVVTC
jgi:hypothetical protein